MLKTTIVVDGQAYPCRETMGAMLRFKQETGEEVTAITESLENFVTYLWCCVTSACKHDKVDFGMGLMDFADALEPDQLSMLQNDATGAAAIDGHEADEEGEKKS